MATRTTVDFDLPWTPAQLAAEFRRTNLFTRFGRNHLNTCLAVYEEGRWRGVYALKIDGTGWASYHDQNTHGREGFDAWIELPRIDLPICNETKETQ